MPLIWLFINLIHKGLFILNTISGFNPYTYNQSPKLNSAHSPVQFAGERAPDIATLIYQVSDGHPHVSSTLLRWLGARNEQESGMAEEFVAFLLTQRENNQHPLTGAQLSEFLAVMQGRGWNTATQVWLKIFLGLQEDVPALKADPEALNFKQLPKLTHRRLMEIARS
jgi:hypothetical protein